MPDVGSVRFPTARHVAFLASFLAVLASVTWRTGDYFSGSLDPVVVGKGVLTLTALALAWGLAKSRPRRSLGPGTCWWMGAVLASSLLGALTAGHLWASGILAVRVALLGSTVYFLLRAVPAEQVLTHITSACGVVGAVAAVTGLPTLASGRLGGGMPAMAPNELALLGGAVVMLVLWRALLGRVSPVPALAGVFFLGVIWETGSRTVMLMLVIAALVMLLQLRRPSVGVVVGGLVLAAVLLVGAVVTGGVTAFLQRDGAGLSTVDSRVVAWRAALAQDDTIWHQVFGRGLSVKIIPVHDLYRSTQPLDSTWMSLLVQAGILGFIAAIGWSLWALAGAVRTPYPHRVLFLGLLVFLLGRSFLESGLFDATPDFMLFAATSLLCDRVARRGAQDDADAIEVRPDGARPARR